MKNLFASRLFRTLFVALLVSSGTASAAPKYGKNTIPLAEDASYFRGATKTDFFKLIPYYVPQHNDKACGVASSVIVLNALFAEERNTAEGKNIDVDEVFKLNPTYKKISGATGKGLTLDELAESYTKVFEKASGGPFTATIERFDGKDAKAELKRLEKFLTANEKDQKNFVVANFLQGVLTGDKDGMIGHISPIGAYDTKKKRVLVMDVDRKYYQPYWVGVDKFFDAINTTDPGTSKKRGLVLVGPGTAP